MEALYNVNGNYSVKGDSGIFIVYCVFDDFKRSNAILAISLLIRLSILILISILLIKLITFLNPSQTIMMSLLACQILHDNSLKI